MVKSQVTSITPAQHADRHSVGGEDPLSDPIITTGHHATHESGGGDVVAGLPVYENTTNFAITTSTAWADLDLSGIVGANRALVILRINNTSAGTPHTFAIRPKGDGGEYEGDFTKAGGCAMGSVAPNGSGLLITLTDVNGEIQMRGSHASALQTIYVMLYIKLS